MRFFPPLMGFQLGGYYSSLHLLPLDISGRSHKFDTLSTTVGNHTFLQLFCLSVAFGWKYSIFKMSNIVFMFQISEAQLFNMLTEVMFSTRLWCIACKYGLLLIFCTKFGVLFFGSVKAGDNIVVFI